MNSEATGSRAGNSTRIAEELKIRYMNIGIREDSKLEQGTTANRNLSGSIPFSDPATGEPLKVVGDELHATSSDKKVADIIDGIPRFVEFDNYADTFGFQWQHWSAILSDQRGTANKKETVIARRTHFKEYDTKGKTVLECGMGGGDDTEILLSYPFGEVYSFDLSRAVERAQKYLDDDKLRLFQASIYDIPFADGSFDFVFCHRVIQHTPDPEQALRCICRKVKPGGVLFVHSYKRSWRQMMKYRYKYRWLTTRIPYSWVFSYVNTFGTFWHYINHFLAYLPLGRNFVKWFIPFAYVRRYGDLNRKQIIELEKLLTFDELTPAHDHPMTSKTFRRIIDEEGFTIEHIRDPKTSPIHCTAVKKA